MLRKNPKTLITTDSSVTTIIDMVILKIRLHGYKKLASNLRGKGDVSLEEKERHLTLEYFDHSIDSWEKAHLADPTNEETKKSWEDSIFQKNLYEKNQLKSLVQRYPNDYSYRYELGINLFENEEYDEYLSHLQLAQRNAKVRLDAILYLGRAYSKRTFFDLAIEQFNLLKNEIQIMDERKKDAIYELGCCLESMGDNDKAIEEFKLVYSADISYKDVADKINFFIPTKINSFYWRRGRDSNPRYLSAHPISSRSTFDHSATSPE